MGFKLVVPLSAWDRVRSHLLADSREHLAFFLASNAGERLLVRNVILVPDEDLAGNGSWDGLALKLPVLIDVMNMAHRQKLFLIEAHSHPFTRGCVVFSDIDLEGQQELATYLADVTPEGLYGTLVFGQVAVKGDVWSLFDMEKVPLDEISVVGPTIESWPGNGTPPNSEQLVPLKGNETYSRQILALGLGGQRALRNTTVAIIGLGGIGSIVAQQLAHLGVGGLILVDDDLVEATNLHRLAGASRADVGKAKVDVAARGIATMNPDVKLESRRQNVRDSDSLNLLKNTDVVLGCVDTDSGRMILNDFALAYLIPYIDFGVGITAEEGRITEAGGRVVAWVPGRPCLLCCNEFRPDIAAEELESSEEREFRKLHGYVSGSDVPEPAVMSLNGTVASLGVTEFLALTTGFRPSGHYTYYDMLEQRVGPRIVKKTDGCVACHSLGAGHAANLERYSRRGLPQDIPQI